MKLRKLAGFGIAAVAAASFAMVSTSAIANTAHHSSGVKCYGGNDCKGKSVGKTANNACKGKNDCKGKGVVVVSSKSVCEQKGGTTVKPTAPANTTKPSTTNTPKVSSAAPAAGAAAQQVTAQSAANDQNQ